MLLTPSLLTPEPHSRAPMPLAVAARHAERIVAALRECDPKAEIAVAGSIRRQRAMVNDIDLVILPSSVASVSSIRARIKQNAVSTPADGPMNLIVVLKGGLQLDVFFARHADPDLFGGGLPCNYGSLLLCRTGSAAFNMWVANQAIAQGYHWNPYCGIHGRPPKPDQPAPIIASETEGDIFAALGLDYIPPEARER